MKIFQIIQKNVLIPENECVIIEVTSYTVG